MKSKNLIFALALLLTAMAANAFSVRLKVLDAEGAPESYATVRIFTPADTLRAVVGGVTDTLGIYSAKLPSAGKYKLSVEIPGKVPLRRDFTLSDAEPDRDLGTFASDAEVLGEVVVTAQRPLVTKEIDRIGYDVQADDDAKTSTLSEILRKVPMLNVDADGNITINGSSDFKIYKNGKPSNSMTKNAKDIFQALPASMIKKVEVITEPGARFDAEGVAAVLNIVTVENTAIKGVTGTASVRATTEQPFSNANLYLMTQVDKVTFSMNGGAFNMTDRFTRSTREYNYLYQDGSTYRSKGIDSQKGWAGWGGFEMSWEPNSGNLFTAEGNLFFYRIKPTQIQQSALYDASGALQSSYTSNAYYPKFGYTDFDATFSYQHSTSRKGETLGLSYMISTTGNDNKGRTDYEDIVGTRFPYTGLETDSRLHFIEHTFQADWTRPFADIHSVDIGAKYIMRRNNSENEMSYVGWEDRYTKFRHITDIGSAYAQYSIRLKKVTLRAGLRYEFSRLKASYPRPSVPAAADKPFSTTLSDWVPSAAASWQINDANSLTLNYATRINRPGIEYLNPAETVTPTEISKGNPDLESSRYQSFKLSYMLIKPKFNMQVSASYGFSNNSIEQYTYLGENSMLYSDYANIGRSRDWSFQGNFQWTAGEKTRLMFNLHASHTNQSYAGSRLKHWSWGGYGSISQKLPWRLEAELSAFVMPEFTWSVYAHINSSFWQRFSPDLSLKRSFLKDDRLSARVSWSGMFKPTRTMNVDYTSGPYTGWMRMSRGHNQYVTFTLSYRFGSLKAWVKKTNARIVNDDMQGGSGSSGNGGGGQGGPQ